MYLLAVKISSRRLREDARQRYCWPCPCCASWQISVQHLEARKYPRLASLTTVPQPVRTSACIPPETRGNLVGMSSPGRRAFPRVIWRKAPTFQSTTPRLGFAPGSLSTWGSARLPQNFKHDDWFPTFVPQTFFSRRWFPSCSRDFARTLRRSSSVPSFVVLCSLLRAFSLFFFHFPLTPASFFPHVAIP